MFTASGQKPENHKRRCYPPSHHLNVNVMHVRRNENMSTAGQTSDILYHLSERHQFHAKRFNFGDSATFRTLIELGFTSHRTQNRPFQRRSSQSLGLVTENFDRHLRPPTWKRNGSIPEVDKLGSK